MNEAWKNIFKDYIDSYNAIQTLKRNDLLDDESRVELEQDLLYEIIKTMKTEVEG